VQNLPEKQAFHSDFTRISWGAGLFSKSGAQELLRPAFILT
jgi:hypothetical protein